MRKTGYVFLGFSCALYIPTVLSLPVVSANKGNDQEIIDPKFSSQLTPAQKLEFENKKAEALASFAKVLNSLESQYVDPQSIRMDEMLEKAITAMLSELDPHTSYLTPEQFKKFVTTEPKEFSKRANLTASDLSHDIMYIKLPLFHGNAFEDVKKNIQNYEKKHGKIQGLVLDLRDNPGGLFDQAVKISNLFIDSGILVSSVGREKNKPQQVELALKSYTVETFPMVVLVNEGTASASEVVAGALQDRDRALIMGTTTYGKGSIQRLIPLANGGALKITIARYYTPSGRSIQAEGIVPDVLVMSKGEAKLKRHLKPEALNVSVEKKEIYQEIEEWGANLNSDESVKQAYLYLRK